jgi:hypothetical protein
MNKFILLTVKLFIPLAFAVTALAGLVYVAIQQNFRMNANDPQIQIAEDFAVQLGASQNLPVLNPNLMVDIATSLSPFVVIYDDAGKVLTGSGKLNGQYPALPPGVLDYVKKSGEDRLTWQPWPDVRAALVVTRFSGAHSGYVAVGRSLREVEKRISRLGWMVLAGWAATLAGLLVLLLAGEIIFPGRS